MGTVDRRVVRLAVAPLRTVGLLALGLAAGCATNPVTGKSELSLVSESQEIELGKQGSADVRQSMGLVQDAGLQSYVRDIGLRLAASSERPNLPWSYEVIDDASVNAFALPGGPVFITRGILAYMQNEAELATVLGHETGHITAKHSVHQISREQLASLALGVGSVLSSNVAALAGIAGQGLGLLFLKYSRDNEDQADDLGFRYALKDGYDVRAMRTVFEMLDRVSAAAGQGRLPQWLSTHPDPGSRIAKTDQRLTTVTQNLAQAKLNRDVFVRRLDGLLFGENPRLGFFDGSRFNHPDLQFRLDFPSGWTLQNQAAAVVGVSGGKDAIFALGIAGKDPPEQALGTFVGQQGIQSQGTSNASINGFPASAAEFQAVTQDGQAVAGRATFLSYGGNTYRLLGYGTAQGYANNRQEILQTTRSFNRLTDQAALSKQPLRIHLVRLTRDLTVEEFHRQYPSTVPVATVALMNGAAATNDVLKSGVWAKRVQ